MKSIAVAYNSSSKECDTHSLCELHLNIWKVREGAWRPQSRFFLDVGVMAPTSHNEIKIYFPFEIKRKEEKEEKEENCISANYIIKDLGSTICNSNELLNAVFNEELTSKKSETNCFVEIEYRKTCQSSFSPFSIYTLSHDNIEIKESEGGTFLTITIDGLDDLKKADDNDNAFKQYYIRFRIEVANMKEFVTTRKLSNNLIQAAFSKKDFFDISVNEPRAIYDKIKADFVKTKHKFCQFSKIHIFYIADIKENVENGTSTKLDSRIIETKIWDNYMPGSHHGDSGKMYMAHHWKKAMTVSEISKYNSRSVESSKEDSATTTNFISDKKPIEKMNLFFTSCYPHRSPFLLSAYLSLAIIIGAAASCLANFSEDYTSVCAIVRYVILGIFFIILIIWLIRSCRCKD